MTQNNDHDFQQFRGAFNDAMIPDAAFKAKMEKLLQQEAPASSQRASAVLASPPKPSASMEAPTRRSSPLMVAVAVLLVFAVMSSTVWVISGDVLEGDYASAPSGIATLPADVSSTPGPDVHLTAELFMEWDEDDVLLGVYDQTILTAKVDGSEVTELAAYDASSGELLWSQSYSDFDNFDPRNFDPSTGALVGYTYTWTPGEPYGVAGQWVTAMHLTTGEILWSHEIEHGVNFDRQISLSSPTIAGGNVAIVYSTGEVRAWDITTGAPQWESTVQVGAGWENRYIDENGNEEDVVVYTLATTTWNDQLVVANGDGLVTLMNPTNGEIVEETIASSQNRSITSPHNLNIETYDQGIVLIWQHYGGEGPKTVIDAVNPATGEQFWQRAFDGQVHSFAAGNGTLALNTHIWNSTNWFLSLLGNHGHSTFQLHWIDFSTGEEILSTERTAMDSPVFVLTDGSFGCTSTDRTETTCFDRIGTRHIVEVESWGGTVLIDGVLYFPTLDGPYRVKLP